MPKLLSEVTAEDFERSKVWVLIGDTEDVEPSPITELVEDDGSVYLAATQFHLADKTVLSGFSSPADDSGLDYVQPIIFYDGQQLALWTDDSGVTDVSSNLGKKTAEVYPIYWISQVRVDGEEREGYIELE